MKLGRILPLTLVVFLTGGCLDLSVSPEVAEVAVYQKGLALVAQHSTPTLRIAANGCPEYGLECTFTATGVLEGESLSWSAGSTRSGGNEFGSGEEPSFTVKFPIPGQYLVGLTGTSPYTGPIPGKTELVRRTATLPRVQAEQVDSPAIGVLDAPCFGNYASSRPTRHAGARPGEISATYSANVFEAEWGAASSDLYKLQAPRGYMWELRQISYITPEEKKNRVVANGYNADGTSANITINLEGQIVFRVRTCYEYDTPYKGTYIWSRWSRFSEYVGILIS